MNAGIGMRWMRSAVRRISLIVVLAAGAQLPSAALLANATDPVSRAEA